MRRQGIAAARGLALGFALTLGSVEAALASDGVIEINQAKALAGGVTTGDTAGFPVRITAPGSYQLTSNLDLTELANPQNLTAIEIVTNEVTINLGGFSIIGPNTCSGPPTCTANGSGIGIDAFDPLICYDGTTVLNGTVRGMGAAGVSLGCRDSKVERVVSTNNGGDGISAGSFCSILDSNSRLNLGRGISSGAGCVVQGNSVAFVGGIGILTTSGSTILGNAVNFGPEGIQASVGTVIKDNAVRSATGFGLNLFGTVGYVNNVLVESNGGGDNAQVSGGIQLGTNVCGTNTNCP